MTCFKIILKVTKNQGFTLSLEDTFFEKPQGGCQIDPPTPHPPSPLAPPAVLGLKEMRNSFNKWPLNLRWISNKTIVEVGNIAKDATFKSYLHLSYKNTQWLFCDSAF